jgi:FixJ family two-component response regulator
MQTIPENALVYVVDDEFTVRDSLSMLLSSQGFAVSCFESADDFLSAYDDSRPSCLILDVRMPLMSGLELQDEMLARGIVSPVIFISGNADIADTSKAFRTGAIEFLAKPFQPQVLLDRVQEALAKDCVDRVKRSEKQKIMSCFNRLTAREKEVLELIVSSHSNKQAARKLDISHRTIDAHRARVMEKMQADSVATLVTMVMAHELVEMPLIAELTTRQPLRRF